MTAEFADWSRDEYEAEQDRMRSTRLKCFIDDSEIYEGQYVTKTLPVKDPTKAMLEGIALHGLVFDDAKDYEVWDGHKVREPKRWAEFKVEHEGTLILTPDEEQVLLKMAERLAAHDVAAPLLTKDRYTEHTILWTHEVTGVQCKARLDSLRYDGTIVDLKKVGDPSEEFFQRQVVNFRYDISAAFYIQARNAVLGEIEAPYYLITICDKPETGHPIRVWALPEDAINIGHHEVHQGLRDYACCLETDDWTNPMSAAVHLLELPGYYWSKYNVRV